MPDTFIHINPNLSFLQQSQPKENLSERQVIFQNELTTLNDTLSSLRNQSFEFTPTQMEEISRGSFYALTKSLEERYLEQQTITLADLQTTLKSEFNIQDDDTINFMILCLVAPVYLPHCFHVLVSMLLMKDYYCTNESGSGKLFKYVVKAKSGPENGQILFDISLPIKKSEDASTVGDTYISVIITKEKQIIVNSIEVTFNFEQSEAKQFKHEILNEFNDWVLQQEDLDSIKYRLTYWPIIDFCIVPILIGLLLGLITMISFIVLSFTPFSPLLLPPLGLALGLIFTSVSSCTYFHRKKDNEKLQRPIYLLNKKQPHSQTQRLQTSSFFPDPPIDQQTVMKNELKYQA